jgi:hypothetical protein
MQQPLVRLRGVEALLLEAPQAAGSFDETLAFLENERNEALKNVAVIGKGLLMDARRSRDGATTVATVSVRLEPRYEDVRLRPYDSVYFGKALGGCRGARGRRYRSCSTPRRSCRGRGG